jgi:tetratricopeptide (TPR) repeat protein
MNANAEHLKSQGNSYFQSMDYQNAIDSYTRCLGALAAANKETVESWEMQKVVLSNRAQAYLKVKKYTEAESDADAALGFESDHVKSL